MATVGGYIDSWCGKCKMMLGHTVEAMVDDSVKRVHCNTCNAQHAYRPHEPGKAPSKTGTRKKKTTTTKAALKPSDYEKYMAGRSSSDARRYSPKGVFGVGEVLLHPKFGTGVTTARKDATKIEVLFPEGPKVLIHNR